MESKKSFCQPDKLENSIPLQTENLQLKPTESIEEATMVPNYISSLINQQNKRNGIQQKENDQ